MRLRMAQVCARGSGASPSELYKKKGLAPYYAAMKARKGSSAAAVATARKLAAVVWRVLTQRNVRTSPRTSGTIEELTTLLSRLVESARLL